MKTSLSLLSVFGLVLASAMSNAAEKRFDCEAEIIQFVSENFKQETDLTGAVSPLHHVLIQKSDYRAAFGDMDIEAYAAFDEEGYLARRIFIGSAAILNRNSRVISCPDMYVKASYQDPLAE
ncbi:MAG: hypothetical protein AB7G93_12125 [Bdellovibrionales bacterium]